MQSIGVDSPHREVTGNKEVDGAQAKKRQLQCTMNYSFKILVTLPATAALITLIAEHCG